MSHNTIFPTLRILSATAALLGAGASFAQQPATTKPIDWAKAVPKESFKAPKITQDSDWSVPTPKIYGTAQSRPQTWGVFEYSFETKALWTDNMTVTFHLLLDGDDPIKKLNLPKDQQPPRFSYMVLQQSYTDIPKGKDHKICAVLPPAALLRFGKPIALGLEVSVGDTVVYIDDDNMAPFLKAHIQKTAAANQSVKLPKWWEFVNNSSVIQLARRTGYLVDRAKTPFSVVAIDDYLISK